MSGQFAYQFMVVIKHMIHADNFQEARNQLAAVSLGDTNYIQVSVDNIWDTYVNSGFPTQVFEAARESGPDTRIIKVDFE